MTTLLQRAFAEAAKRSEAEQDLLASRLLAELAAEDDFDRAIQTRTSPHVRVVSPESPENSRS